MSTVIGTIKAVIGQAWIVGVNGARRPAIEGEPLVRGEEVITGQGAVTLSLPDGKTLDLGRASSWSGNSAEPSTQDLAAAQQAIAQGADPTQILEATAAGTPTATAEEAGDGGGGHSSVVLDLTGQILDPTAGYPTSGIDVAFTGPVEEQTLLYTAADPGSDTNLPPVAPPVTPPVPPVTPPVTPPEPPVTPPEPPVKPPLPQASITLDAIATDNILNMKEAAEPATLVSGTIGHDVKPGDIVTVTINGNEYSTVVGEEGRWSVEVNTSDLLASGEVEAQVTTRDEHGNEATAHAQGSVGQATLSVEITIDTIGGDGYLNNAELKEESTTLSGRVSEGTPEGTEITLTLNGDKIGTATVNADGTWSTTVDTSLIKDGGKVQAEISLSDEYGNEVDAKAETTVEPRPLSVEITIDTIGGDGYLNNAELKEESTTLSGRVSEGTPEGTEITLTLDGDKIGTATVNADGTWSTTVDTSLIMDGGKVQAEISLSDKYGNEVDARAEATVEPRPLDVQITIDDVTGDNFLSFAETNQLPGEPTPTIKVTGTVSGNAAEGDFINVTVGEVTQTVKVQKDGEGKLVWEAEFTAENLMNNPEVSASIVLRDDYGNVVNDSALTTVKVETGNLITGNEHDNIIEGSDETSDLIIADTQGFQQQPGQDYNIAFIVDTSGSVGSGDIKSIIASLTTVFNALHQNAQFDTSGKVNILLVDFDTQVNFAVSVDLRDTNALKTLTDALAKMTSGGGTNYEDAFKTTANWFHEVGGEGSENLTYFITDGKPTYYQSGEKSSIDVDSRSGSEVILDLSTLNYTAGQVVKMNIAGVERVVIDAQGNVYSWNTFFSQKVGVLRADGKGGFELSTLGGEGSSTSDMTTNNALSAFALLMGVCNNVEAIGINNGITANDLKAYDSDGNVMSGIAADKLAEAILGGDNVQMAGAQDTVHGNAGNDILFGDMVLFDGSSGFDAMKAYVAGKLGVDASKLGVSHISQYIAEHPEEFDQSQNDGGRDVLFGGQGDDILYGGGGSDILVGGSGDDLLFGGKGDDILLGDGYESASKLAEAMNTTVDKLTFEGVADFISQNSDILGGMGSGNDKLYGGEGNDILMGGGGHDLLNGGDGNDLLFGGTGNDVLIGGKGNDTLTGGEGQDTFTWLKGDNGHDVIKDFNADQDRIDLSELLGGNIKDLADYIQVSENGDRDAVININTDGQMQSHGSTMSITVEGYSAADINNLLASPDNTAIIL